MKARTLLACVGTLFALATGIAACGNDDPNAGSGRARSGETSTGSAVAVDVPKGWVEGKTPRGLEEIAQRLQDAGYTTSSPKARRAQILRVRMREGGSAYVIKPEDPPRERDIAQTNSSSKGRMRAAIVGSRVFFANSGNLPLEGKDKLSDAQLGEFEEIIALGRGDS
jgi:hypothetical protein